MKVSDELHAGGLTMALRAGHTGEVVLRAHMLLDHPGVLATCSWPVCCDGRNATSALLRVGAVMMAAGRERMEHEG